MHVEIRILTAYSSLLILLFSAILNYSSSMAATSSSGPLIPAQLYIYTDSAKNSSTGEDAWASVVDDDCNDLIGKYRHEKWATETVYTQEGSSSKPESHPKPIFRIEKRRMGPSAKMPLHDTEHTRYVLIVNFTDVAIQQNNGGELMGALFAMHIMHHHWKNGAENQANLGVIAPSTSSLSPTLTAHVQADALTIRVPKVCIYNDNTTVTNAWGQGRVASDETWQKMSPEKKECVLLCGKLYREFKTKGGVFAWINGDFNKGDLGWHTSKSKPKKQTNASPPSLPSLNPPPVSTSIPLGKRPWNGAKFDVAKSNSGSAARPPKRTMQQMMNGLSNSVTHTTCITHAAGTLDAISVSSTPTLTPFGVEKNVPVPGVQIATSHSRVQLEPSSQAGQFPIQVTPSLFGFEKNKPGVYTATPHSPVQPQSSLEVTVPTQRTFVKAAPFVSAIDNPSSSSCLIPPAVLQPDVQEPVAQPQKPTTPSFRFA